MTTQLSSRPRRLRPAGLSACALIATACSATAPGDSQSEPGFDQRLPNGPPTGALRSKLTQARDCDELLRVVQTNVLVQLSERADQLRSQTDTDAHGDPRGPVPGGTGLGAIAEGDVAVSQAGSAPQPLPPRAAEPSGVDGDFGADDAADEEEAPQVAGGPFSGTTVQVSDVDEADIVKADGDHLYVLHGGTLFKLLAWPADATEIVGSALLEGSPREMFVHDGKAVVFSDVYQDLESRAGNRDARYGGSYTKLTVLDVSTREPSVLRESFLEGGYVSARRHDSAVRVVVRDGFHSPQLAYPNVEYIDPFGQPYPQSDVHAQVDAWLERTSRSVQASSLEDWLPSEFLIRGDELEAVAPRCEEYFSAPPGITQSGITQVVALDLNDPDGALSGAMILGNADRVYANNDALVVTHTDYGTFEDGPQERTLVHRFDLAGLRTTYAGSGSVPGYVHNQFSIDEREGVIRLSTTENRFGPRLFDGAVPTPGIPEPAIGGAPSQGVAAGGAGGAAPAVDSQDEPPADEPASGPTVDPDEPREPESLPPATVGPINRVVTLGLEDGELLELGSTDGFGATERIFATRFIGDLAYVVTFRRTDPLFVVDLSDPAEPTVRGELHIPGFSDYLYPLGPEHLFAIGQDADASGRVLGLALQIFDVSDPDAPALAHKYVFEDPGYSPANVDHRAITFHAERDLIAFPFQDYRQSGGSLEVFGINAESGIERLGALRSGPEELEACLARLGYEPEFVEELEREPGLEQKVLQQCSYNRNFRRGVFRDDLIYGISNQALVVQSLEALDAEAPLASAPLPGEVYDYGEPSGTPGMTMVPRPVAVPPAESAPPEEEPAEEEPAETKGPSGSPDAGVPPEQDPAD